MSAGLRFRVWVGGSLVLEEWADYRMGEAAVMEMAQRHSKAALASGRPWLVEVFDPDQPKGEAFMRFGSDPAGMVDPVEVSSLEELRDRAGF